MLISIVTVPSNLKIPENLVSLLAKASYLSELSTEVEGVDVLGADVPTDGSVEVDDVMEVDDEVPPQAANKLIDNIPNINDFFSHVKNSPFCLKRIYHALFLSVKLFGAIL